jgi:predicted nucleic acid-binding protein
LYLLDTNVISELRRLHRAQHEVVRWASSLEPTQIHISVISVLEIEIGALRLGRKDKAAGVSLRTWIDTQVLPSFADRMLPVDTTIAMRCAALHVPDPRPERDALIAATALVHGMILVTRNTADFQRMGLKLLNPWQ